MTAESLIELSTRKEPLLPELEAYSELSRGGWTNIKHPLVFSVMHDPSRNAFVNAQYLRDQIERRAAAGEWDGLIWLYEKPYRISALLRSIAVHLTDVQYWRAVGDVLTNVENLWQCHEEVVELIRSRRPHREAVMNEDELSHFRGLPRSITCWRGCSTRNRRGFSWTLSPAVADRFSRRCLFGEAEPEVRWRQVSRGDVFAFFGRRGEKELFMRRAMR